MSNIYISNIYIHQRWANISTTWRFFWAQTRWKNDNYEDSALINIKFSLYNIIWDSRSEQKSANLVPRLMKEEQLAKNFDKHKISIKNEFVYCVVKESKHIKSLSKKAFKEMCLNCDEERHSTTQYARNPNENRSKVTVHHKIRDYHTYSWYRLFQRSMNEPKIVSWQSQMLIITWLFDELV